MNYICMTHDNNVYNNLTDVNRINDVLQGTSSSSPLVGDGQHNSSLPSHPSHDSSSNKAIQVPIEDRSMYEKFIDDFDGKRSSSSSSDSLSGSDISERVVINDSLLGNPETDQLLIPPCPGSVTGSSGGSRPGDDDDRDSIGSACDIIDSDAEHAGDSDDHEALIAVVDNAQNDQLFLGHTEGSKHLLSDTDCCSDSDGESRPISGTQSKVTHQLEMITISSEQDLDAEVERNLLCQVIKDKDPSGVKQQDLFGSKPFTETSAKVVKLIPPPQRPSLPSSGQDLFGAAPFALVKPPSSQVIKPPVAVNVVQKSVVSPQISTSRVRDLVPSQQVPIVEIEPSVVRRKSSVETTSVSSSKGILQSKQKQKETVKKKLKQDPKKKEITQSDEEEVDGLLNDDEDDDAGGIGGSMMAAAASSGLGSKSGIMKSVKESSKKKSSKEEKVKKEEKMKEKKEDKKKDEKKKEKDELKKLDSKKKKEEKKSSKRDKSRDNTKVQQCSGFANLSFEDQTEQEENRTGTMSINIRL